MIKFNIKKIIDSMITAYETSSMVYVYGDSFVRVTQVGPFAVNCIILTATPNGYKETKGLHLVDAGTLGANIPNALVTR